MLVFGFWIGYPVFLALFLRFYARESWKLTLALTAGSWAILYGVLAVVLEQILFEGFLTSYVVSTWFSD